MFFNNIIKIIFNVYLSILFSSLKDTKIQYNISEIEYDLSVKLNSSLQFGADILNLLLLYADLMFLFLINI